MHHGKSDTTYSVIQMTPIITSVILLKLMYITIRNMKMCFKIKHKNNWTMCQGNGHFELGYIKTKRQIKVRRIEDTFFEES